MMGKKIHAYRTNGDGSKTTLCGRTVTDNLLVGTLGETTCLSCYPTGASARAANKPEYITGTGQKLWSVHPSDQCAGEYCVIHNPSDHSMRDFPTHWRSDRKLMERLCPHGIGHPDPDLPFENGSYEWIHGCDLCCIGAYIK